MCVFAVSQQSFDELIELASKGDARNVDQYTGELVESDRVAEGDSSLYSRMTKDNASLVYCFI